MNTSFERILILLAASNLEERDYANFFRTIRAMDMSEFLSSIRRTKFFLHELDAIGAEDHNTVPHVNSAMSSFVGEKVASLLQGEAGLPIRIAVDSLKKELMERGYLVDIDFDSKRGLRYWVDRLARVIPEGELLFVATTIRNRFVHDDPAAWRLK